MSDVIVTQIFITCFIIVVIVLAFRSFEKVIVFLAFTLPVVPDYFGFIVRDNLPIVNVQKASLTIIGLLWLSNKIINHEKIFRENNSLNILIFVLAIIQGLTCVGSEDFRNSVGMYFRIWVEWYFVFFIVSDIIKTPDQMTKICNAVVISSAVISIIAIVRFVSGYYLLAFMPVVSPEYGDFAGLKLRFGLSREYGVFEHSILYGMFLNIVLPFAICLYAQATNKKAKIFYGFLSILTIISLYITFSRAALFGELTTLLIIFCFIRIKKKIKYGLIALILLGIINVATGGKIVYNLSIQVLTTFGMEGEATATTIEEYKADLVDSRVGRIAKFQDGWKVFRESPFLGHGLRNEQQAVGFTLGDHIYLMKIAIESGLLGLVSFLSIIFVVLQKLFLVARTSIDSNVRLFAVAFICSITGYLISIQAATFYNIFYIFWIVCGMASSLIALSNSRVERRDGERL